MASRAFVQWEAAGRPITPAQPIREFVEKLKAAFPGHANEFGWYADASHYEADYPEDHTPYSADGWPLPDPHWVVFATDVMNTSVGGAAANDALFQYWLAEAKAGRAPWIKYLIWQGHIYDVRHGWVAQPADGHFDHVHVSARTDFEHLSLGAWSVVPGAASTNATEGTMRFAFSKSVGGDDRHVYVTDGVRYRIQPLSSAVDDALTAAGAGPIVTISTKPNANWSFGVLVEAFCGKPLDDGAELAGLTATVQAQGAVIQSLVDAVKAGGGNVDTAAIMAAVNQSLDQLRAGVEADVRDALADEAEGGAAAVRADN